MNVTYRICPGDLIGATACRAARYQIVQFSQNDGAKGPVRLLMSNITECVTIAQPDILNEGLTGLDLTVCQKTSQPNIL